jgi:tRNA-dihydrouridine synthase B
MAMMVEPRKSSSPETALPPPLAWVDHAPFFQAGLAGYSDAAMRLVARRHGAPYCITEAMLDMFLINGGKGLKQAELDDEDHPIAGQLMGSHPADIVAGAKVLLSLGYDVIDINLACPVKKIKKKCRGGHLLSVPDEAIDIIKAVRDAVGDDAPLTIKLRRAYDETPEAEASFHQIFEAVIEHGFAAATVHGRTVQQKYDGPSKWPKLAALTQRYRDQIDRGFLIMGSGDIFSAQAIFDMIEQTGVAAVSVARGCIGDPWVFRAADQIMRGEPVVEPTIDEQREVLAEHFELSVKLHGEQQAGRMMRKFGIKFSRHHPRAEAVKDAFIKVKSLAGWRAVLDEFYATEAVGA